MGVIAGLLLAYLLPAAAGWVILGWLARGRNIFSGGTRLVLGLLLGISFQSLQAFWLGLLGIGYSLAALSAAPALIAAAGAISRLTSRRARIPRAGGFSRLNRWEKVILPLLGVLIALRLALSVYNVVVSPTYFDDSVSIWNFKAQVFYHQRGLVLDREHPDFFGGNTPKYPNGIPLFKAWLAFAAGGWRESVVNSLNPVFYLAGGALLYLFLGRIAGRLVAAVSAYLMMSLPLISFHSAFAYSDLALGVYFMAATACFYRWLADGERPLLVVAALLYAGGAWIKDEGLYLLLGGVIPLMLLIAFVNRTRQSWAGIGWFLLAAAAFLAPWMICKSVYRFPAAVVGQEYFRLEFHPRAFAEFVHFYFRTGNYNIFWSVYLVMLAAGLVGWRRRPPATRRLLAMNLLTLGVVLGPFVFTPLYKWLAPGATINRAMLTVIPMWVLTCGVLWGEWSAPPRLEPKAGGKR